LNFQKKARGVNDRELQKHKARPKKI